MQAAITTCCASVSQRQVDNVAGKSIKTLTGLEGMFEVITLKAYELAGHCQRVSGTTGERERPVKAVSCHVSAQIDKRLNHRERASIRIFQFFFSFAKKNGCAGDLSFQSAPSSFFTVGLLPDWGMTCTQRHVACPHFPRFYPPLIAPSASSSLLQPRKRTMDTSTQGRNPVNGPFGAFGTYLFFPVLLS